MFNRLLYYALLFPLSLLPLSVLYLFSSLFYVLFLTIFPYRRKVIRQNLKNSFPEKSAKELKKIERAFYKHFSDLLIEGVKNFSISDRELKRRYRVTNPELMEELYKNGKSVLLVSGHYNNWEWLITAQNLLFTHQAVGIGMPLTSGFWDKKLNERRSRFGMKVIHSKIVKSFFEENRDLVSTLVLADQSPGDSKKAYWMEFLNQPTAVLFGTEMLAHTYNHAVVFFHTNKVKRGYYEMNLQLITESPKSLEWGEITELHTKLLETQIIKQPAYWLWSHKRWKREIPENMPELKSQQKAAFNAKFN